MSFDELAISDELYMLEIHERAKAGVWVGVGGKEYQIKEMTAIHIKNCINMINNGAFWFNEYINVFENELKKRGVNK